MKELENYKVGTDDADATDANVEIDDAWEEQMKRELGESSHAD